MSQKLNADRWCILRTSGRSTLSLEQSLAEDGFEVWTPAKTETHSVPSATAKRQVRLPITPGFVFARIGHLIDLLELAAMPVKPRRAGGQLPAHRPFRVLRCGERLAIVADGDLEQLRKAERRMTKPAWAQRAFRKGQMVRATSGSFQGLSGFVERSSTKATVVCFGGFLDRVEIPTSLLTEDEVINRGQANPGTAARKAA